MTLQEALSQSAVNAAFRPYYISDVDPVMDKQIVVIGNMEDIFIVYAETKKFWKELPPLEEAKIHGKDDWNPVAPPVQKEIKL